MVSEIQRDWSVEHVGRPDRDRVREREERDLEHLAGRAGEGGDRARRQPGLKGAAGAGGVGAVAVLTGVEQSGAGAPTAPARRVRRC